MIGTKKFAAAAIMAAAGFGFTPAHATSLLVDGNFDNPLAGGSFVTISAGSSFGGPDGNAWLVTNGAVQIVDGSIDAIGSYWQAPPTGGGSVDLDGNAPGGISQSLSGLVSGQAYTLQFYLSGNPDGLPATKAVTVTAGNQSQIFDYTLSGDKSSMNYDLETLSFVANGTDLIFKSNDVGSPYGPVIGGVSITSAVPEPATWAMMLIGFGSVGFTMRGARRKQSVVATA